MSLLRRDPVCGMPLRDEQISTTYEGTLIAFCSDFCRQEFIHRPELYGVPAEARGDTAQVERAIAYFSMEIFLQNAAPTFSGGLGVLAGDMLRSCADLRIPIVAVTLLSRQGYFRQRITPDGTQNELPDAWSPESLGFLPEPGSVEVQIEGRAVHVSAYRYNIFGATGFHVPVLLLDSNLERNEPRDRALTDSLYGGDARYRLAQEAVLGIGGVRMLKALGFQGLRKLHLNEGHASLAAIEWLRDDTDRASTAAWPFIEARKHFVFTTHTAVAAGHDTFERPVVEAVLGNVVPMPVLDMLGGGSDHLDMTSLALNLSGYVNGVAKRHREVSEALHPGYEIHDVTNGVHSLSWTSPGFKELFDRHLPGWRNDPSLLRNASRISSAEVLAAHDIAKDALLALVAGRAEVEFDPRALTVGFARRATGYKRMGLLFGDEDRLRRIAGNKRMQFIFAGKAHPRDDAGKAAIARVISAAHRLAPDVRVVFLEGYDTELAEMLVAGCDLWLNTPLVPLEASGTSGMKAAHNGVPSLSTLDGWWLEGHVEGVTGWSIGTRDAREEAVAWREDAAEIYRKLDEVIWPAFQDREKWATIMRHCIALNASHFNTHRVVQQYAAHAYL